MTTQPSSLPRVCPDVVTLDDLDLLRDEALGGETEVGPHRLVTLDPTGVPLGEHPPAAVVVTDAEGVPLAQIPLQVVEGHLVAGGEPLWLGRRSARPFERFHMAPAALGGPRATVVLSHPVGMDLLERAMDDAGPRARLLVLASTDAGGDSHGLDVARQARQAQTRQTGPQLVIAPLSERARQYAVKKDLVVAAYARGGRVVDLTTAPHDPVAAGLKHRCGLVLFFTGLSGSGKSTVARAVSNHLLEASTIRVSVLDGDLVRQHLSKGLGFSAQDRDINVRRIGWVAAEVAHHGGVVICSPIAPFERTRQDVRSMVQDRGGRFALVHVSTPLEECERRDRKGLYARARRGEIPDFTGISSPYEAPSDPDLVLDTTGREVDDLRDTVLDLLTGRGWLDGGRHDA